MKIPILRLFDKDGREVAVPAIRGPRGPAGDGTGDMVAEVYDPQGKATDVFQYADDKVNGHNESEDAHADIREALKELSLRVTKLAERVTALEAGGGDPDEPDEPVTPDEPVNPDVPATYTKVDEFEFNSESDEEGNNYLYFGRDAGWFWGTGIGGVSVGRYVSFSGDASGAKYLVTEVIEEPGQMGDELSVYFSGTYTPEVTDIVTVWERG